MKNTLVKRIILLAAVFSYSWVVSQSFMYVIALENVQLSMEAASYIELRQLLDTSFRANFKFVLVGALVSNLLLLIVTAREYKSVLFVTAAIAFIGLITDTLLTLKGNVPINDVINTWTAASHPADWHRTRAEWLTVFHCRQLANGTGFLALLAGLTFGRAGSEIPGP